MLSHSLTVAAAVLYAATNDSVGVAAFHLQTGSSSPVIGLGCNQSTCGMGYLSPNTSSLLKMNLARETRSSQPRISESFAQVEGRKPEDTDVSALAMASFLRCHKPLLNDRGPEIPDGNLCMLLRGCDAHQRMISPLELKTNEAALPGANAARLMASKGPAAAQALCEQLKDKLGNNRQSNNGICLVNLLSLEVEKMHRLLQYATAAGLKKNFLNQDALIVMLELYEEVGLDNKYISKVLHGLKEFYKGEMDSTSFTGFFLPAFEEVIFQFEEAKKHVRPTEKVPYSSLPFEPTPDPRTLTPLVVDIMSFKDKLPNIKAWEGKQ